MGPLLICGLMLVHHRYTAGNGSRMNTYLSKTQTGKNFIQVKPCEKEFSFFKDVIANILPALKNLN
jgi:hypothetical protein